MRRIEGDARAGILVVGIGARDRGDDGVGFAVTAAIRGRLPRVDVRDHEGEGVDLLALWEPFLSVYLVDAIVSGATPGTIRRLDLRGERLPFVPRTLSSHWMGVHQAVELARMLGTLPPRLVFYGVEAARFETGTGLSREVAAAVPRAAARLGAELRGVLRLTQGPAPSRSPEAIPSR